MSVRYEIVRLLGRLGVALGPALSLAAIAAVVRAGGDLRSLELCYVVGALVLTLVLGAAGNSPGRDDGLDVESRPAGWSAWRTVVGDPANAPTNTVEPAVPFLFTAAVLIVLVVALASIG